MRRSVSTCMSTERGKLMGVLHYYLLLQMRMINRGWIQFSLHFFDLVDRAVMRQWKPPWESKKVDCLLPSAALRWRESVTVAALETTGKLRGAVVVFGDVNGAKLCCWVPKKRGESEELEAGGWEKAMEGKSGRVRLRCFRVGSCVAGSGLVESGLQHWVGPDVVGSVSQLRGGSDVAGSGLRKWVGLFGPFESGLFWACFELHALDVLDDEAEGEAAVAAVYAADAGDGGSAHVVADFVDLELAYGWHASIAASCIAVSIAVEGNLSAIVIATVAKCAADAAICISAALAASYISFRYE